MKWVVIAGFLLYVGRAVDAEETTTPAADKPPAWLSSRAGTNIPDLVEGKICLPGTQWMSQCNDCICTSEGLPSCTERICEASENELVLKCAPHSFWKIDCNRCWCPTSGIPTCTRMGCRGHEALDFNPQDGLEEEGKITYRSASPRKARATSQASSRTESSSSRFPQSIKEAPKTCQPGTEFRLDCNTCLCDNEGGTFSCTRIDCVALNNNNNGGSRRKREVTTQLTQECQPGTVFQQGCKICKCAEDGRHVICPTRCQNEKEHSENDISNTDSDPSFRCNPGEQFKRACNDCTCSADGRGFFCTLRLCEEDITPTI